MYFARRVGATQSKQSFHYKGKRRNLQALSRQRLDFNFQDIINGDGRPVCEDDLPHQLVDSFDRPHSGDISPAVLPLIGQEVGERARPARLQQQAELFVQKGLFLSSSVSSILWSVSRAVSSIAAPWPARAAYQEKKVIKNSYIIHMFF